MEAAKSDVERPQFRVEATFTGYALISSRGTVITLYPGHRQRQALQDCDRLNARLPDAEEDERQ